MKVEQPLLAQVKKEPPTTSPTAASEIVAAGGSSAAPPMESIGASKVEGGSSAAPPMECAGAPEEGSSSSAASKVNKETSGNDITHTFVPLTGNTDGNQEINQKERFLNADLLVPGISLKKFKQALETCENTADQYLALLSVTTITKYKVAKPILHTMVMGRVELDLDFWNQATHQLKGKPVTALMVAKNSPLTFEQVLGLDFRPFCIKHLGLFITRCSTSKQRSGTGSTRCRGHPPAEVMEQLPMSLTVSEHIYMFELPVSTALGANEKDYSNVQVTKFASGDGAKESEEPQVEYVSAGKLGTLTGGLLHMKDFRKVMDTEMVQQIAEQSLEQCIQKKRTGVKKLG